MKRRKFVATTGIVAAGICTCGPGMNSCSMITGVSNMPEVSEESYTIDGNQIQIDLTLVPELQEIGGSVKLKHGNGDEELIKVLIARRGENEYLSIENRCTHGGREIAYDHELQCLQCVSVSHSKFDLQGNVTGGPAPGPLTVYQNILKGNSLVIDLR